MDIESMNSEAKNLIYKVYIFCAIEAATYITEDGYFQKFHKRTASATGITEVFLTALLKEKGIPPTYNEILDDTIKKKLEATIAHEQMNKTGSGQSFEIGKHSKDSKKWPPFIKVDIINKDKPNDTTIQDTTESEIVKALQATGNNDTNTRRVIKIRRLGKHEAKMIKESQKICDKSKKPLKIHKIQETGIGKLKFKGQKTPLELCKPQKKDTHLLVKAAVKSKSTSLDRNLLTGGSLMIKAAIPKTINSTQTATTSSSIKTVQVHSNDGALFVKAAPSKTTPNTNTVKSKSIKLSEIIPTDGNIVLKAALPQTNSVKDTIRAPPKIPSEGIPKDTGLPLTNTTVKSAMVANYQFTSKPIKLNQIVSKDGRIIVTASNKSQIVLVKSDQNITMPPLIRQSTIDQNIPVHSKIYSAIHLNTNNESEYIIPDIDPLRDYESSTVTPILCVKPEIKYTVPIPYPETVVKEENMIDDDDTF